MLDKKPNDIILNISRFIDSPEPTELTTFLTTESENEIFDLKLGENNLSSILFII